MKNREIFFYSAGLLILIFGGIMLIPTGSSDISKLYETKGSLMTQKADLLKQDLETRNKIDEINKQVIVLDGKLSKLINPTEPKEVTGAIEMVNKELGLE